MDLKVSESRYWMGKMIQQLPKSKWVEQRNRRGGSLGKRQVSTILCSPAASLIQTPGLM